MNGFRESEMMTHSRTGCVTYNHIVNNPVVFPYHFGVKRGLACVGVLLQPQYRVGSVKVTGWGSAAEGIDEMNQEYIEDTYRTHHPLTTPASITCSG